MASRLFAVDLDLGLNKAKQFVFEDFSSDPTAATGRVYFNTTGNRLKVYNGTAWKSVAYTDDSDNNTTYDLAAGGTTSPTIALTGSDSTTDTVTFAAGTGISLGQETGTITITNTVSNTNTTYSQSAVTTTGGANLRLTGSDSTNDDVKFAGAGSVSVARTDADTITITGTDTNTTYDLNAGGTTSPTISLSGNDSTTDTITFAAGTGITLGQSAGTITVTSSVTDTNTTYDLTSTGTTTASINLVPSSGGTDSVTITGSGATSVSHSAGAITISSTDNNDNYYPSAIVFNAGTTAGPTLDLTMSGAGAPDLTAVAIPSASGTASGIVTTGAQTFAGTKTFSDDIVVTGDLTVNGNTVTLNTATLSVEDNIIILNNGVTGTPAVNAGIEVERGTSTNASVTWNESTDTWTAGLAGSELPIARKYVETVVTTGGTPYPVVHNLGTTDIIVQTYVSGNLVDCDIDINGSTTVDVTTNAGATVKVVVIG